MKKHDDNCLDDAKSDGMAKNDTQVSNSYSEEDEGEDDDILKYTDDDVDMGSYQTPVGFNISKVVEDITTVRQVNPFHPDCKTVF